MSSRQENLEIELESAETAEGFGRDQESFRHLERAHILGQSSTYQHVRVHWRMLRWAIAQRACGEFVGQIFRIAGALAATPFGFVPIGNTGGSNVSPFRRMAMPADLAALLPAGKSPVMARLAAFAVIVLALAAMLTFSHEKTDNVLAVDVSGHRLAFKVMGSGRPAMVFLSGLGDDMSTFSDVARELSSQSTVITYDRAGYGDSEAGLLPRDAESARRDLFNLLAESGVPGPYILVGHSLGGLYAEYYAAKHPAQIAGLVLEDSRPADFTRRCQELADRPVCVPPAWLGWIASRGARAEIADMDSAMKQVGRQSPLKGKPVLILSRSKIRNPNSFDRLWADAQRDLALRYPGSRHLVAPGGGHAIHEDQKKWYLASIGRFLKDVRSANCDGKPQCR